MPGTWYIVFMTYNLLYVYTNTNTNTNTNKTV